MGMSSQNNRNRISEINITPLVDVMLVLLIIFMISTPMLQQGIDVKLPVTEASGVPLTEQQAPIIIGITKTGAVFLGEKEISLAKLTQTILSDKVPAKNKKVYIRADKSVDYGRVAEVMAKIRASGIESVGLVTTNN